MIVPGTPSDPIQIIDVRDLANWLIHCLENNIVGVFNATGPASELTMKALLEGVRTGVSSKTTMTWVDYEWLKTQGITEGQFPLYAPPAGETAGFHRCNVARALAKGLTFRAVADTARATFEWYQSLPPEIQTRIAPQFAKSAGEEDWLAKEKNLLEKWRERTKK
jgi:2'-hydroxyisoflavone reductase